MQQVGVSRNKEAPPNNAQMSFNHQQPQPGVIGGWPVDSPQSVENGFSQPYQQLGMSVPPQMFIPDTNPYYNQQQPMFGASVEMFVNPSPVPPHNKEPLGRASIAVCSKCNFRNFFCESELAKCDSKNANLMNENKSLKLRIKQLEEQLKKNESTKEDSIAIKRATSSHKVLRPDAMEFSPKRQDEVPIVSAKGINEESQDDLVEHQVVDQEDSTSEIVPTDGEARARNPNKQIIITGRNKLNVGPSHQSKQELENEQKPAARKQSGAEDTRIESYEDHELKKDEFNTKLNQDNAWSRNKNEHKRRGGDQNFGQDGRDKNIKKKNDGEYHHAGSHHHDGGHKSGYKKKDWESKPKYNKDQKTYEGTASSKEAKNSGEQNWRSEGDKRKQGRTNFSNRDDSSSDQQKDNYAEERGGKMNDHQRHFENRNKSDKKQNYQERWKPNQVDDFKGATSSKVLTSKDQSVKNIVREIDGDLFTASTDFSLGHCVAQDFRMGSGIAVRFKEEFRRTGELLNQNVSVGGCAYLKDSKNNRYIFYLVTKAISSGKPTLASLHSSLEELRNKCQKFGVTKLAIPRIGCGLDRLDWDSVKEKINKVFGDTEMDICAYNFNAEGLPESEGKRHSGPTGPRVIYKIMKLKSIDPLTALLIFGTEDGHLDSTAISLDEKFNFKQEYQRAPKTVGKVWLWDKSQEYYIYSLIISKTFMKNKISFDTVEESCKELSILLRKHKFNYVGLECLIDWSDDDTFTEKVVTVLRNSLPRIVEELWVCFREEKHDAHQLSLKYASKSAQY